MQIGNAVAPPMSAALGRCLLLAAAEEAPVATPVVEVRLGGVGHGRGRSSVCSGGLDEQAAVLTGLVGCVCACLLLRAARVSVTFSAL